MDVYIKNIHNQKLLLEQRICRKVFLREKIKRNLNTWLYLCDYSLDVKDFDEEMKLIRNILVQKKTVKFMYNKLLQSVLTILNNERVFFQSKILHEKIGGKLEVLIKLDLEITTLSKAMEHLNKLKEQKKNKGLFFNPKLILQSSEIENLQKRKKLHNYYRSSIC